MCDPVTALAVTSTAVSIGGAVADHFGQNKKFDANKQSAVDALALKDHELSLEEVQQRIAGSEQKQGGAAAVLSATGDVQASAASRGVAGMTTDLLLGDVQRQGAEYGASVDRNTNAAIAQTDREKDAAYAEAQSRINGVAPANPFLTALRIGGSLTDYATKRTNMSPKGVNIG